MPKLLSSGNYNPKEYSFDDYIRYTYLLNRMTSHPHVRRSALSINATEAPSFSKPSVVSQYIRQLKLLNQRNQEIIPMEYIDTIMSVSSEYTKLRQHVDSFPMTENEAFNREFRGILDSLTDALWFIYNRENNGVGIEDSDVYSPKARSLDYWYDAWYNLMPQAGYDFSLWQTRVQTAAGLFDVITEIKSNAHKYKVNEAIVNAHITNLKMIIDPNYHNQCMQAFSPTPDVNYTYLLPLSLHVTPQPGFLLSVYQDPLFQHWLVRAILLALIITAAFVAAAFMVKVAVLPVAVAGFVTSLSKLAANTIFGTAVSIGVAATATLVASIHASFFSAGPRDNGGASSAAFSLGYQVR